MTALAVHWHEGMFLRPQHLQAAHRHILDLVQSCETLDHHYYWGLREFVYDRDALKNHKLVVRRLRARLRDGTYIFVDDGELPAVDVKPLLKQDTADIYIGVAKATLGHANVAEGAGDASRRFLLDAFDLKDENTGLNPQRIQLRRLNVRLLLPGQDQAGFETLRLLRLETSTEADAAPQLHLPYIPSLLACDAWPPLLNDVLQKFYQRVGRKVDLLADQMISRGISLDNQTHGDSLIIDQLRVLNEADALLKVLVFARGVHPLLAYVELCRLVGRLAIFGEGRRTPDLPEYDHDDLGGCFHAAMRHLDTLLNSFVEPNYKFRYFEGAGKRMQVALDSNWLEDNQLMFIGVKSSLPAEECIRLLTSKDFKMKIGSAGEVDRIFSRGSAGLKLTAVPYPPRVLPTSQGLVYLQVTRDLPEWDNVRKSLSLAIRMEEQLIVGTIQDQRVIHLKVSTSQTITIQFTLYVVQVES